MKQRFLFGLILLTALNLSALGAFFYHREKSVSADRTSSVPIFMREDLGLSEGQIAQMEARREVFHPKVAAFSEDMHRWRLALVRELMAEEPDLQELERIVSELGSLQVALQREVVHNLLAMKAIFTPAQQERFFSLVLERFAMDTKEHGYRPGH